MRKHLFDSLLTRQRSWKAYLFDMTREYCGLAPFGKQGLGDAVGLRSICVEHTQSNSVMETMKKMLKKRPITMARNE